MGVVVRSSAPQGVVDAAFDAIRRYEAELSEWDPSSRTALAVAGQPQRLDALGVELFRFVADLRVRSGGAFNVGWRGGDYVLEEDLLSVSSGTRLDLGGVLKGFLADRAAEALRAHGVVDFAVDVGGDVVVGGTERPGSWGWPVQVVFGGTARTVHVTSALSTSSQEQQPGHIVDARSGSGATGLVGVFVEAPTGMVADGVATAIMARGEFFDLPEGACASSVDVAGRIGAQCGSAAPMWRQQ